MSGHSKWATTKRQKAVTDSRRAKIFTKLSKNITVAARAGADATMNAKLRLAIELAKTARMPKDNIERAIARGSGSGADATQLEEITYEGFGPGGVGIILEAVTDNKNRTSAALKHLLSKGGGTLAASGSVAWQFERLGVVTVPPLTDEQTLALIEAGSRDITSHDDQTIITTEIENLELLKSALEKLGLEPLATSLDWIPKTTLAPENPDAVVALLEALDEDDDVTNVYTNAEV